MILYFLILIQNLFSYPIVNTENVISSEISAITVFLNNAEITRTGNRLIPVGKSDIIFNGISSRILQNGIKLDASEGVKVYAIRIESDEEAYLKDENYLKIEKDILNAEELVLASQSKLETLKKEMLFLETNMKVGSNNVSFDQIDKGIIYFRTKIEDLQKRIAQESKSLQKSLLKVKEIRKKKRKLKANLQNTNSSIRVTLISQENINCNFELKYLVSNALWKPNYSIRAKEQSQSVFIEYQAQIYNDTGNDWDNKPITLAILDSSDDILKPELNIWTLEDNSAEYSGSTKYSRRRKNSKRKESNNEPDQEFEVLEVDDLSTRFELNDLFFIPSDAKPHLIDIINYEKQVKYYTLSIPKTKNGAFKIAQIKDWKGIGFLDGSADLYLNDTYQGTSELKTQQINDTLDISLGRDNNFTISRRKVSSKSKKNLIGFNIKEIITYEILIKNNKDEMGTIFLKDQIPVSTSKDVEVKPLNISNGQIDILTGQISWTFNLQPNEIKKVKLQFSIKYPKKKRNIIKYYTKRITTPRYF